MQFGVVHLDPGRRLDIGRGNLTGSRLAQVHDHGFVLLGGQDQALEVEDDLGDVLDDALQGGELVLIALDLDGGHGRARDGRQQGATHRVAEGVAETGFEGLDDEP